MPSTIPYDPSLVLGNVVDQIKLGNVVQISKLQAPADAAEANLNSLISLKKSLDMTMQEMSDMGIDAGDLVNDATNIDSEIKTAAIDFAKAKMDAFKAIQPIQAKLSMVSQAIESPIDYNKSMIKQMPLATDSMQMNTQYFSFDGNTQSSNSHAATVAAFVSESLSVFGEGQASQASTSAQQQVNSQTSRHSISGTVVICITCTHKNAQVFAPLILDVDKAVRAWNAMFKDDMITTGDPIAMAKIQAKAETADEKSYDILSGATYGSSFVGMVHILDTTDTSSSQNMESIAASLQETFDIGGWFASGTGGYGVDSSFSKSAKNLLSTQNVQSHCSLITMGIIPSIKSNEVKIGVQGFAKFDPATAMQELSTLQGATASENNTISSAADAARTGQQMITLKTASITAALSGLADIDEKANLVIDTNSMMTAMDDYIQKCIEGGNNLGVPINYFLKPITQSMIARAWLAKYFPNKFNQAGAADDSTPATPAAGPAPAPAPAPDPAPASQ